MCHTKFARFLLLERAIEKLSVIGYMVSYVLKALLFGDAGDMDFTVLVRAVLPFA
jgi:Cu/Ag efflux pump CusA